MFEGMGNLASMLNKARQLGGRMQGMAEELKTRRAVGSAGGGLVEVEVNGLSEVLKCRIDPSLMQPGERELLEDLVAAAMNQAGEKAKALHAEALKAMTGSLDMPGLDEAMAKLTKDDTTT